MPFMSAEEINKRYGLTPAPQAQVTEAAPTTNAVAGEDTGAPITSEFSKGFRSAWQGWQGNYARHAALAAEAAGNQQASDRINKAADTAVTVAPRVQSAFDIGSMRDAGDYAAGVAGQTLASVSQLGMASAIGGLLGAGLAGRGGFRIGSTLGGLGDAILQQAGSNLAKQQESAEVRAKPIGERALAAYGTGAVQGGLDYVTEMSLLGKVAHVPAAATRAAGFRGAMAHMGKEVGKDMLKEASTEAAQEGLGQAQNQYLGDTRGYDAKAIADNAIAGAVGGGLMGAPGSVRHTLAARGPDGTIAERVAGSANDFIDGAKQRFTDLSGAASDAISAAADRAGPAFNDLGAAAGAAAADPMGTARDAAQAAKDKFSEWADMAQGTAAGKFTSDVVDSFTGAYRKKAEELTAAARAEAKANPAQATDTFQQAADALRNLWHDSKRTVTDLYDSLRSDDKQQTAEDLAPAAKQQPATPTQEASQATPPAAVEPAVPGTAQATPAPQSQATGFRFNEDNDAGLTAFLSRPDSMRQSLAETYQTRLAGADPLIASLDPTDRRDQAALAELNRRDKAGEPLDFEGVMRAVDEQVGGKPGEKQYSLLRDSYDNFHFMNNRMQGDAVKEIPAERRQEVLRGVEGMIRSGKLLQSTEGQHLLERLFGDNANDVLQYVAREPHRETVVNDTNMPKRENFVSLAEERADAAAVKEDQGWSPAADRAALGLGDSGGEGVRYRKGAGGLPMRRDSAEFKQHELALKQEAGANQAQSSRPINALQYLREGVSDSNRTKARDAMLRRLQARDINDRIAAGTDTDAAHEAVKSEVSRFGEDAYLAKHYVFRTDDRSPVERGLSDKDWESLRATGKARGSNNITVMRDGKPTVVNPVAVSMLGQRSLEGSYKGIDNATVARFFAEGMSQLMDDPTVNGFSDAKGNAVQFTDKMDIAPNTVVYVRNGEPVTYGQLAPHINKPTAEQAKANAQRDMEQNPPYERGKYSHLFDNSLLAGEEDMAQLLDEVNGVLAEKRESANKLDYLIQRVTNEGKRAKAAGRLDERNALAAEYREMKASRDKMAAFISRLEDRAFELESGDLDMIARGNLEREQGGSTGDNNLYGESTRYKRDAASDLVGQETGYETDPGARNAAFVGRPLKEQPTKQLLEAQRLDALRQKGPEGARALLDFAWTQLARANDPDSVRNPDTAMRATRNTAARYYSPAAIERARQMAEDLPEGPLRSAVIDGLGDALQVWKERGSDLAKQVRDAGKDTERPAEAPYNKRLPPPHTMTVEELHDELTAGPTGARRDALLAEAGVREEAARNGENYEPRPHTPVDKAKRTYDGESPVLGTTPVEQMSDAELRAERSSVDQFLTGSGFAPTGDARYDAAQKKLSARYSEVSRELQHRGSKRSAQAAQEASDARGRTTVADYAGDYGAAKPTPERNAPDYTAARKLTADLAAALKGDTKPAEFVKGMKRDELQQLRGTLQDLQPGLRRNAFLNAVNDALKALDKPDGDGSGGGKGKAAPAKKSDAGDKQFSKQAPSGQGAREKFVREYLHRVFGEKPTAVFNDTLGFAGSYDRDGDFFEFSLHAPMGTEAHEALHRWFKKLQDSKDPGAQEMIKTIIKASTSERTMARLRELLKDHPEAIKQLSDPEEAAAYAFQFHSYGLLKLESAPARTAFGKIIAAVKKFLKMASDEQRTQQFFDYFAQGKWAADKRPSAVAQVVRDSYSADAKVRKAREMLAPLGEMQSKVFRSAADRLHDTGVPALKDLSRLFKAEVGDDGGMGFLQRAVNTRNRWINSYAQAVNGLSDKQKANVLAFVRGEEVTGGMSAEENRAVKAVRSLLDEVYNHAQKRDVPLKRRANYFPRVWDAEKIRTKQQAFIDMLVGKYNFSTDDAHRVRATLQTSANDHLVNESPEDPGYNPFFSAVNERKLPQLDAEDIKPFLETSLDGIMARYLQQASKRIEYEAKFGAKGERIHQMLGRAERQGASTEDIASAKAAVMAMEGTLPADINPRWQAVNDAIITYQNVRLLPLSILTQATDAIGIAARSGNMGHAWEAFKQGIKDVPKWLKDNPKLSAWDQVAMTMGVLENTALEDVSQTYFNTQTNGLARTINDNFFKWTLMDGWNKSMRVMATKAATEFIAEHAAGKGEHSERMLRDLGLTVEQAQAMVGKDGKLMIDPGNERQREAIFRFVDQSVIRANPADRTVWGSDPRFAVLQHLKQYTYSFHRNMLAHAKHEAGEGNWAPAQMLATYVPVMAASMYVKALASNGGAVPPYMAEWGLWDWVWNAFDRSGIAGLYNYHLWDLPGPTVGQAAKLVQAGQKGNVGPAIADAVPGHQLLSVM